jgi:hypothetical protein
MFKLSLLFSTLFFFVGCYKNNQQNQIQPIQKSVKKQEKPLHISQKRIDEILSYNYNFDLSLYDDKNNSKQLSRDFILEVTTYLKKTIYNDVLKNYPTISYDKITEKMIDTTYHLQGHNWFFSVETNHGILVIPSKNKHVKYKGNNPLFNIKNDPISDTGYLTLLDNLSYEMNILSPTTYKKNIDFLTHLYKDGLTKVYIKYPNIRKLNPSSIYTIKHSIERQLKVKGIDKKNITPTIIAKNFKNIKQKYIEGLGRKTNDLFYIKLFATAMKYQGLEPVRDEDIEIDIKELLE